MHIVVSIAICFLAAWLILWLDHRATFIELFTDIPGLLFAMALSFGVLYLL